MLDWRRNARACQRRQPPQSAASFGEKSHGNGFAPQPFRRVGPPSSASLQARPAGRGWPPAALGSRPWSQPLHPQSSAPRLCRLNDATVLKPAGWPTSVRPGRQVAGRCVLCYGCLPLPIAGPYASSVGPVEAFTVHCQRPPRVCRRRVFDPPSFAPSSIYCST